MFTSKIHARLRYFPCRELVRDSSVFGASFENLAVHHAVFRFVNKIPHVVNRFSVELNSCSCSS